MINSLFYLAATKIGADEVKGLPKVSADNVIAGVLYTVYFAAALVAVVVLIICGLLYVISQGDASKTNRAKDGILYTVVGLIIIFAAYIITRFIVGEF